MLLIVTWVVVRKLGCVVTLTVLHLSIRVNHLTQVKTAHKWTRMSVMLFLAPSILSTVPNHLFLYPTFHDLWVFLIDVMLVNLIPLACFLPLRSKCLVFPSGDDMYKST